MLEMKNIDLAIKNFRCMLKSGRYPTPRDMVEFCLQNTLELKALRERTDALDEISQARKEKREPSLYSWSKLKRSKEFLQTSNKEYFKDFSGEAPETERHSELDCHNRRLAIRSGARGKELDLWPCSCVCKPLDKGASA